MSTFTRIVAILIAIPLGFFDAWCIAAPAPVESPKLRFTLELGKDHIEALVFSPDGKILATAHRAGTAQLWDVTTGKVKATFKGPDDKMVWGVAFSPDGKTLASCGDDKTVRLWNIESGKPIAVLEHRSLVSGLAFSPDGKTLAAVTGRIVNIWDLQTNRIKTTFTRNTPRPPSIVYSPKGNLLVVTFNKDRPEFCIWDANADKLVATCKDHESNVMCVGFNAARTLVASGDVSVHAEKTNIISDHYVVC
jgi:WD40 repeat protein